MRAEIAIAFAAMTAVTYMTRSLFTVSVTRIRISPFWERTLLILPLAMPVLILGANTVSLAAGNDVYTTGIWALGAYAVASLSLAPYATAAALRISNE